MQKEIGPNKKCVSKTQVICITTIELQNQMGVNNLRQSVTSWHYPFRDLLFAYLLVCAFNNHLGQFCAWLTLGWTHHALKRKRPIEAISARLMQRLLGF